MKLVPINEHTIRPLCELWNREIGGEFPIREALFRQNSIRDANVVEAGSWAALADDGQSVAGFVVSKIWREQIEPLRLGEGMGWISVLLVGTAWRGQGIGSRLLGAAEQALRQYGVRQIHIGGDPWHYFPGVPKGDAQAASWLERRGYKYQNDVYDVYRNMMTEHPPDFPSFRDGVSCVLLSPERKEDFLAFLERCFPGRWLYEAVKYFEYGGTGREFVVLEREGEIVGFCRINDAASPVIAQNTYWAPLFREELGGIGPLGVDPDCRNRGYGLALVQAAIRYQYDNGIRHLAIDWTGIPDFYRKLGFAPWKTYGVYCKSTQTEAG